MTKISNQYSLTNVLFADAVNGRVGIGTTSPGKPLEVYGPTLNTAQLKLFGASSTNGKSLYLGGYGNGSYITSGGTFSNGWVADIATTAICGIQFDSQNAESNIVFSTTTTNNTGPNERMRIAGNGNVGIGTSSPTDKLEVQDGNLATYHSVNLNTAGYGINFYTLGGGARNTIASIFPSQVGTARSGDLVFLTSNSGAPAERMRIGSNGFITMTSGIAVALTLNSSDANGAYMSFKRTGTDFGYVGSAYHLSIGGSANDIAIAGLTNITFASGSSLLERMRITAGGFIKISNTGTYANATSNYHEIVTSLGDQNPVWIQNRSTSTPYGPYISFPLLAPNNLTQYFLACGDSATSLRFVMYSNGSLYNSTGVYAQLSDIKLKENIVDATPKLDDLLKVKIRNYNLIGDGLKQIGVIAQELEEIFPNMIDNTVDKDTGETTKGVKYSIFIPMLIKAIQEQQTQINELKALLNAH